MHELNYNLRVPQRWPERQNHAERLWYQEQLEVLQQDPAVEIWYGDEAGIEGDPRPRRRWSAQGSRPQIPYTGDHIRTNVVGAVCPETGRSFSMLFDLVDTDAFQCYLDHLADAVLPDPSKRRILILDNASWHKSTRLNWHHFERGFLPAYSPDFNPIEHLWLRLKADYFRDFIARSPQELDDRACLALNAFIDDHHKSRLPLRQKAIVFGRCSKHKKAAGCPAAFCEFIPLLRLCAFGFVFGLLGMADRADVLIERETAASRNQVTHDDVFLESAQDVRAAKRGGVG